MVPYNLPYSKVFIGYLGEIQNQNQVARGLAQGEHLGRSVREAWEVHDSHPAAVRALLRFIYTAKVPEMEENGMVVEVLKLADFFEVLELKAASKEEMIRWLFTSDFEYVLFQFSCQVLQIYRHFFHFCAPFRCFLQGPNPFIKSHTLTFFLGFYYRVFHNTGHYTELMRESKWKTKRNPD